MDTRESINFMEIFLKDSNAYYNEKYEFGIKEVIKRLKEDEKYKQIVEDVKQYVIDRRTIEEGFATNGKEIIDLINWLKRKHFPKAAKVKECNNIEKLKRIKSEFTEYKNSYSVENFMKVCIKLFEGKQNL